MKKKAILSISFGSNDAETMQKNLDVLEAEYKEAHKDCTVYRAITNEALLEAMKDSEEGSIYAVRETLARMLLDGVTHLYAQPAYILNGTENEELREMIFSHKADFVSVECGTPLMNSHKDIEKLCEAIMEDYKEMAEDEAVVFVGHGSNHYSSAVYCEVDYTLKDKGYKNASVCTFNAFPQVATVVKHLKEAGIKKVNVAPFMYMAGKKAMDGICGDGFDSIKKTLEGEGFEVKANRKCLGEYEGIRKIYMEHLDECFK